MITVDLLRRAGVSDALIVRVIELEQAETAEANAAYLERKRINQRNYRERCRVTGNSDRVPVTAVTEVSGAAGPARGFLKEVSKKGSTSVESKDSTSVGRVQKNNKIPFPKELLDKIPEEAMEIALRLNVGPAKARSEWSRFGNSCLAHDRKYANLMAAWRNWLTSPYQTAAVPNGRPQQPLPFDHPDSWKQALR